MEKGRDDPGTNIVRVLEVGGGGEMKLSILHILQMKMLGG